MRQTILGIMLIGLLSSEAYWIFHDIPLSGSSMEELAQGGGDTWELLFGRNIAPPLGETTMLRGSGSVSHRGSTSTDEARAPAVLRSGDLLETYEHSRIEVALYDGSYLVLEANSRARLDTLADNGESGSPRMIVQLLSGSIQKLKTPPYVRAALKPGKSGRPVEIRVGASSIRAENDAELAVRSLVSNGEQGHFVVRVQQGSASVDSREAPLIIRRGEEAVLIGTQNGPELRYHRMAFLLLSPRGNEIAESPDAALPVRFRWEVDTASTEGSALALELSPDPGFKADLRTVRIAAAEPPLAHVEQTVSLPTPAAPVTWYWRIRTQGIGRSDRAIVSEAERFILAPAARPNPRFPPGQALATAGKPVDFSWRGVEGALNYELQLDDDKIIRTNKQFTRVDDLKPGTLFWRVRAVMRDGGLSPWSISRDLKIRPFGDAETRAPAASAD